jgi:hypothetical protein
VHRGMLDRRRRNAEFMEIGEQFVGGLGHGGLAADFPASRPLSRRIELPRGTRMGQKAVVRSSSATPGAPEVKRLLIFALLGPPLGLATGLWGLLPIMSAWLGGGSAFDLGQIVLLPLGYMVGLVPALLACGFDETLARLNVRFRVGWTALFGFAASFVPLLGALSMGFLHGPFVLAFGLVGATPASVCSWLSGRSVAWGGRQEAPS